MNDMKTQMEIIVISLSLGKNKKLYVYPAQYSNEFDGLCFKYECSWCGVL